MSDWIELDPSYSTTRRLRNDSLREVETNLQKMRRAQDEFVPMIFHPAMPERKGQGGLRTKGFFKKSYTDKPLISVITVVFNGDEHLEQTILSVISQPYENLEYIIVDGGSTDLTIDIIKKYESVIDYWISESDNGIYDAMNKACRLAHGSALIFLNSGDRFIGDLFSSLGSLQCFLPCKIKESNGLVWARSISNPHLGLPTAHQAILFPNQKRLYNTAYLVSADYDYFLRHNMKFEIAQDIGAYILYDNSGFSTKNKTRRNLETITIIYKHFGLIKTLKYVLIKIKKRFRPPN